MAIDPAIWADIQTRIKNLRGDLVGQWQGDLENGAIERTIMHIGIAIQTWDEARPRADAPPVKLPGVTSAQTP